MRNLVYFILLFIPVSGFSQPIEDTSYFEFLKSPLSKECLSQLDSSQISELLTANIVIANNHRVSLERKQGGSLVIDPFGLCNEYRSISMHYLNSSDNEYMFVYRRYSEAKEKYGELQLYGKKDGKWTFGKIINFNWQHFFSISDEEIDRLKNLNQYPNYLVTFKPTGIEFTIPWELYSFDQGSEVNGYVKGNGSQPILLSYENLLR
jgi:hypothetical protein